MSAAQVFRICPVCRGSDSQAHLQKEELRLVRCGKCTMIYANPVPTELASGEHYDKVEADYYLSPNKLQSDYADVRFDRELRLFRRYCSSGAVLDVGCSSGAFLFQLNQRFPGAYEILGTDASGPTLDCAESRGVPVVRGRFTEYDFGGRKFDAVTFWAVVEHLLEPERFIEKAWSVIKPGGYCFVLVPNMNSLAARLLGARYRYIYPQHLNYFTKATLTRLVEVRFAVLDLRFTHFNPIVIWQDWQRSGGEVPSGERAQLLKRTTRYKQCAWLKPVKAIYTLAERMLGALGLADNLVVVLRKGG